MKYIFIFFTMILFGMMWYGIWMAKTLGCHHRGEEFPLMKPCSWQLREVDMLRRGMFVYILRGPTFYIFKQPSLVNCNLLVNIFKL
jgi:hypothetical protein